MGANPQLINAAIEQGQNLVNTGLGLVLQKHNDARQLRQQQKLQNMQLAGQERMTDYNFKKQLEMWHATGYGAQMDQLKEAGLNPGLIYGMSGGGGQTANVQPGHVQGSNAPVGGGEILGMMMTRAQIRLMEAQAKKTEAEAVNVPLQGKNIEASTDSIRQGITNQKAVAELTEYETRLKAVELEIQSKSQNYSIAKLKYEAEEGFEKVRNLKAENLITEEEAKNIQSQIALRIAGMGIENGLKKEQTKEIAASILQKWAQVAQGWAGLSIQEQKNKIEQFSAETKAMYPGIFPLISKWINYTVEALAGNEAPEAKPLK